MDHVIITVAINCRFWTTSASGTPPFRGLELGLGLRLGLGVGAAGPTGPTSRRARVSEPTRVTRPTNPRLLANPSHRHKRLLIYRRCH